jgi:arylsulfatase A-like enzyme/Tfp pilus assembly protein PilF
MRGRHLIVIGNIVVAIGAIAALVTRPHLLHPEDQSRLPNVLLITIDTLRWDHVGAYGARDVATPALDGLAARGVRFETAIMHVPLTAPSHASILTGLTPLRHGIRDNGAFVLPASLPTLATIFRDAGYATGGFISGFPLDRRFGFARGFDVYDDRLPRGRAARGAGGTERRADETTARVIAWIDRQTSKPADTVNERPWFFWVHYFDPHAAYEPPPEYLQRFPTRPYDGEIAFVDAQIARLLDHLRGRNTLDRTIALVTADHGESLGEHGEETHGVFVYDSTLRVPFVVAGARVPSGRVIDVVARGVDLLPTILDLAGLPAPPALDGRSLRPAIEGRAMPDEPAYIESLLARRNFGWAALRGLRDARAKYIDAPSRELYDLAADPGESINRFVEQPQRAAAMARLLDAASDRATPAASEPVTADAAARLRALGYIGSTSSPQSDTGHDPKDRIRLLTRLEHAIADTRVDPSRAASALRAVLEEDEGIVVARRQLAVALSAMGDHRGAIEQVRWLDARRAASAEDLLLLSESLRAIGDEPAAASARQRAARMDPSSPEIALTEARASRAERRGDEAARAYERALDLSPGNPEALTGLGQLALARGDLDRASMLFARVLEDEPRDVEARTGLALVRGRQGRIADAIALLQAVVSDAPGDGQALAALGAALARGGRPDTAVAYFERAIAAGVRTPAVLNGLGFAKLESGDRAGALRALQASLSLEPKQPGVQQAVHDLSSSTPPPVVR